MPDILQIIRDKQNDFTKSYKILASYVENHMVEIAFLSIQALSEKTHVSAATIHRFCLEIGMSGYPDFQREIQKEIKEGYKTESSSIDPYEEGNSIVSAQILNNMQILQEMLASCDELNEAVTEAARTLIEARRVFVVGLEGDFASACSTTYDFVRVLDNVVQLTFDSGSYMEMIHAITREDVLYVISFRVYNEHILEIVNRFLKAKAKIVTLSDEMSPFNAFASVKMIPKHTTPSYGSVMKVTVQRALLLTIIQQKRMKEQALREVGLDTSAFEQRLIEGGET